MVGSRYGRLQDAPGLELCFLNSHLGPSACMALVRSPNLLVPHFPQLGNRVTLSFFNGRVVINLHTISHEYLFDRFIFTEKETS